ncbi:hypothetical protein BU16DRAFT_37717 [Lophium mytilinum]|uniref:Uncharacterized protein n=1 Tax=Lophium mytilinum TaxID=390894 RepID=A0A6A6RJ14_9PEZI|nr:hypothetical protein BU16DRAFT_37717 [Lophium mytilinum]
MPCIHVTRSYCSPRPSFSFQHVQHSCERCSSVERYRRHCDELEERVDEQRAMIRDLKKEKTDISLKYEIVRSKNVDLTDKIEALENGNEKSMRENEKLKDRIEALQDRNEKYVREIVVLKDKNEKSIRDKETAEERVKRVEKINRDIGNGKLPKGNGKSDRDSRWSSRPKDWYSE